MRHTKDFYAKYFIKHPEQIIDVPKTVFISTDQSTIAEHLEE